MKYKMLDLFSGLGGASQAMEEDSNWDVTTVDFKEKFEPDICRDILNLKPTDLKKDYDLIWASPPCPAFSMSSISHYFEKFKDTFMPKKQFSVKSINMIYHTLFLINSLNPDYWFLENPKACLRKFIGEPTCFITYCQYGEDRMKPTDLWGKHPPSFQPKNCSYGSNCHESAPRGSKTGTQGKKTSEKRAKVPYDVSKSVKESVENPGKGIDEQENLGSAW